MQKEYKNKAMESQNKDVEIKTESPKIGETLYFFPGGLEHEPQSIYANSHEEAREIYEKTKKKIK